MEILKNFNNQEEANFEKFDGDIGSKIEKYEKLNGKRRRN